MLNVRRLPQSGLRPPFVLPHPLIVLAAFGLLVFAWLDLKAGMQFPPMTMFAFALVFVVVAQRSNQQRAKAQQLARARMLEEKAAQRILTFEEPGRE